MNKIPLWLSTGLLALLLTACGSEEPGQAGEVPTRITTDENNDHPTPPESELVTSEPQDVAVLDLENLAMTTEDDFVFITSYGAKGTLEFVDSNDSRVTDLENYFAARAIADDLGVFANDVGDSWEYLIAEVDNIAGQDNVDMAYVTLYDSNMSTYTFTNVYRRIDESTLLDDHGMSFALGLDPDGRSTTEEFRNVGLTLEEFENIKDLSGEAQQGLADQIAPQEKATFILAMSTEDGADLPHEIDMVTVAAHSDFDEVYAYNMEMAEYEEWLAEHEVSYDWELYEPGEESTW